MISDETFRDWAPDGATWSPWAKPVLFTQLNAIGATSEPVPECALPADLRARADLGIVVDLPGAESILAGLELARRGFRPVPLFNGTTGPNPLVDCAAIGRWIGPGAEQLRTLPLGSDAPPAFLLDADRLHGGAGPRPGCWDNRWITFPQDFPSGMRLRSHGIASVLLVQRGTTVPQRDLAHVLLPWQQSGVRLESLDLAQSAPPVELRVAPPSRFRRAWYRAIALIGLSRNDVGGFGAAVPVLVTHAGHRPGFFG